MIAVDEYNSLAYLQGRFQVSYGRLEKVIREQGIAPAFIQNGCRYFSADAVDKIESALKAPAPKPSHPTSRHAAKGGVA